MLSFISRLDPDLSAEALADQLLHWWQGENRALRRKMERAHERVCSRGKGVLINRVTGESIRARCKSWRECSYCAWLYGLSVQRLFDQVKRLRAFVVFTMPPESGDWSKRESLVAQAQAKRRLEERLTRRFSRRFASCWTREHNTSGHGSGRLHLNVIWDEDWVDQEWLSETARACGFGRIVDISRIGERGRHAVRSGAGRGQLVSRYATKALRYSTKDLSSQTDWPKGTRRWGASRTARAQMKRPEKNPDWYFSLQGEVPSSFLPFDVNRYKAERSPLCLCLGPICFVARRSAACRSHGTNAWKGSSAIVPVHPPRRPKADSAS
jgi:hypothetical protein